MAKGLARLLKAEWRLTPDFLIPSTASSWERGSVAVAGRWGGEEEEVQLKS